MSAPVAGRRPITRTHHGDVYIDDFEWLREKENPDVIAYLDAENAYTDEQTAHLTGLQDEIFEEIKARTKETDLSVPIREGDWWYYARTVEGSQYAIRARVAATSWIAPTLPEDGSAPEGEQVVLDGNIEAEGHEFYSLGSFEVSADGRWLLWGDDTRGDERYTLRIRSIETGERLADEIPGTGSGALFDPSGRYVFYTTVDESWRPDRVWRHEVGAAASADVVIFEEPDDRYWVGIGLTRSRKYLAIQLGSKITSEAWILDANDPTGTFSVVWPRRDGVEYDIEHAVIAGEDRLLITHNDGAEDFAVVSAAPDGSDPRSLVEHRPGTRINGVDAFAAHLVLSYRRDGLERLAVASADSLNFQELGFDEELFSVGLGGNPEWEQPALRFGYSSFVTPATTLELSFESGARTVLKQQPVLGGYDPALYTQKREWAVASDGTRVPISLVYRTSLVDGPAPLELYGYGSYEASIDPGFSIPRLSLLDRGVVFAVAHVRGGGEMGRSWYDTGKTLTKTNTFTDFVAVASFLVEAGWTTPVQLVAEGGSAGGLLMGAVANIAPELFAGILAVVPFVDPLTSILDPDLPLTVIEWDEWGDPLHDPEIYALMKSYSPYENVSAAEYPRILAVTSLNDTRVLYVEPAKWVAALRLVDAPVLLKCEMVAGHGGVSGRYESWRKRAFELAWMLDVVGAAKA
jgi:oligopeptidase B